MKNGESFFNVEKMGKGIYNMSKGLLASIFISALYLMSGGLSHAQIPTADFSINNTVCQEQNIELTNNSTDASAYAWDFCEGDLLESPSGSNVSTIATLSSARFIDVAQDNSNWYGFVTSRNNHTIVRLSYGNSLDNVPTVENLGNIGGLLNSPEPIRVINENGLWYAMVHNGGSDEIIRITFGSSLANTPSAEVAMSSIGDLNSRMEFVASATGYFALLTYWDTNAIDIVRFGSSLTNNPTAGDVLTTSSIVGATNIIDIAMIEKAGNWYGIVVSYGSNTIHTLSFGSDIYSDPTASNVTGLHVYSYRPYGIDIEIDNNKFVGYMTGISGDLVQLNFGESITTGIEGSQDLSDLGGTLQNTWNIVLRKENSNWYGFSIDGSSRHLYKMSFPNNCNVTPSISNLRQPDPRYSGDGTYNVGLRVTNSNFQSDSDATAISVSVDTAPSIAFTVSDNECLGQSNQFTAVDGGGLSYEWSFDGGLHVESTMANPTHTFAQSGDSIVVLTVNNGTCINKARDTVSIFPVPATPTFFTSSTPHCTGANISFTNLFDETNYNGATLTYNWNYSGEGTSSERNGSFQFASNGTKTVTLTASIPGCSTPSAEPDLTLIAGPTVAFSYGDKCLGDVTTFTNQSTGDGISGQTWDFGDSNGSTQLSPSHTYGSAGNYNVSLTVDNAAGCSNTLVVPLTVDDKPNADFNMGVGCEGQAVGFEDASTVSSANIESYDWNFGGLGSSDQEDPLYIFESQGLYAITLAVESTYGCTDEVTKNLNVQLAPEADFNIDLGCLDAATQFIDATTTEAENPINIWYWDINGDIVPNTQNPVEIFDTPGEYTVTLTVTPSNLCTSTHSESFTIHELPIADFTYTNACDNEFTSFADASTSATTTISAYNWQFDEENTGNSNPALFNFTQAGEYQVSLTVIDEIGCESSVTNNVTINTSPTAAFSASTEIGPAPLSIDFTNTSDGASNYLWQFNDANQTTSTEVNPQFSYTELGDYNARLIASNDLGCSDTLTVPIIVANPMLDLELVQVSSEESEGKINLTLTVKNSGTVTIKGFDIRIDLDNNSSIFEKYDGTLLRNEIINYPLNFTFSSLDNNIDYICINLIDYEEDISDANIVNNESCLDFNQQLIVENSYPNPASSNTSTVRINMILPTKAPIQIFLLDATGGVLFKEVYTDTSDGLNSFFLDIYSYEQGMYFIKVIYDGIESTQRFVKL